MASSNLSGDYGLHGDGLPAKRARKVVHRRTVDYTSTVVRYMQVRMWQHDIKDSTVLQPTPVAAVDMLPTVAYPDNPATSFATKFVHTSMNKNCCSINCVVWTPPGRRLITGSQSGEFTLWNGQSFNFEMILQLATRLMIRQFGPWYGVTMRIGWSPVMMVVPSSWFDIQNPFCHLCPGFCLPGF